MGDLGKGWLKGAPRLFCLTPGSLSIICCPTLRPPAPPLVLRTCSLSYCRLLPRLGTACGWEGTGTGQPLPFAHGSGQTVPTPPTSTAAPMDVGRTTTGSPSAKHSSWFVAGWEAVETLEKMLALPTCRALYSFKIRLCKNRRSEMTQVSMLHGSHIRLQCEYVAPPVTSALVRTKSV